ncbi:MFS family permease [Allocatelliglobosispora scoriae]|uniref:MFS family permease n=1 Tax=Allocatelliglobosispora scoriae TaxID=643052 RepID=A0A841C2I1_9ACTN|nr:MFS transporter [Allocatelliglobosispora scoriae]MBB5874564.1 MFS family permease [Allocatelliglobosispora scoriae]
MTARTRLLRNAEFRWWYLSRSVSVAGTAASAVMLPLLVYGSSGSAALTAAIVGLEAAPYLLFGLFAGAAADRLPRRTMMICADLACAVLMAVIPIAYAADLPLPSWLVLLVAFGIGTGFCWFDAAAWGSLTGIVGRQQLAQANSLIWSTAVVIGIAAPAAAGLLAALTSPATVLLIDAGTYLASAALISRLRSPTPAGTVRTSAGVHRTVTDITEGLRFLWRDPVIRTLSLTGFGLSMAGGGITGLLIVHADEMLGIATTDKRIGLLYTAGAVGALGAAWLLTPMTRRIGQGRIAVIGYALFTVMLIALATITHYPGALLIWAVWQLAYSLAVTNTIVVRQQRTPDELQGRVNTTGRMIVWGGTPFGALLGGVIAETATAQTAYLVLTAPVTIGLLLIIGSPVLRLRPAP